MTLGDLDSDPLTGKKISAKQRLDEIVAAAVLTEEFGLDAYSVGEHHDADWVLTAPPVVLAAISAKTEQIRLMTGVTLIGNLDPVRVAEDYGTVDLLSGGRLELVVAKGLFPHPWPLFGQDESRSRERLSEGVDLLLKIWSEDPLVRWKGSIRPEINNASIGPRPLQAPPRIWTGVSTGPESANFAADRGLPIFLGAHIKSLAHAGSIIEHFRERTTSAGFDASRIPVGAGGSLYVRGNGKQARREFRPYFEQGARFSLSHRNLPFKGVDFDGMNSDGALLCGSPAEIAERLIHMHEVFGHDLHMCQPDVGGMPWDAVRETMELFAAEVAPVVKAATGAGKLASELAVSP
jgi:alkanesulfonate monooxygenase SsuD/methylene tetrahydromethanopterin reductase-like flavin-dependent oxidoreductase (luciferase family)